MINIEEIKPKIKMLAEKYGLSLVLLFGSQVTGKTHPKSDIDLAFISEKPISPMEIAKMQTEFSEELGLKNIEMIALNGAHPLLLKQVAQKSIVLFEKEPSLFSQFKIYAIKRYMESKKLFELRELSLNKFLQKL
jgi:predicted nucleotidyltransferase